jgi:signal transduction histidine kinase
MRAITAAALCALIAVAGFCAGFAVGPRRALGEQLVEDAVTAIAWSALAAALASRSRPAGLALGIAAASALGTALNGYALLDLPGAGIADPLSGAGWVLAVGLAYTVVLLRVADARPTLIWTAAAGAAVLAAGLSTSFTPFVVGGLAVTLASVVTAFALLALRMRTPSRRRRLLPVAGGAAAGLVGLAIGVLAPEWAPVVQLLTVPLLPLALALAPAAAPHPALVAGLEHAADPLAAAIEALRRDLGLAYADVAVAEALEAATPAHVIASGASPTELTPLIHLGRLEGHLRTPPLDEHARAVVASIAPSVAAVLASDRLVDELRRSRGELVVAREEERRRVRRDLHDEVGPLLSAVVTQADAASLAFDRAPERARDSLQRVSSTSADAVIALRRVVQNLRPAAVDELGLRGALDELAAGLSGSTRVAVQAAGLGPLPAAVEVALYRIAAEAAGNAVRHARASVVTISLQPPATLTVTDDGAGLDPAVASPGVGLASMRERAAELGGTLTIESGAGGTTVRATL